MGKQNKTKTNKFKRANTRPQNSVIPVSITPPLDPPTIVIDRLRVQTFTTNLTTTGSTETAYSSVSLVARIRLQAFNAATVPFQYQILSVQVWAPAAAQTTLAITETASARTWEDNGGQTQRARVGYKYDPPAQVVRRSADSTNTLFSVLSSTGGEVQAHIRVRFWAGQSDVA